MFKQARFGISVGLEGAVAIEMIRRDIQADSDIRAKLVDGFELEAGEFENIPLVIPGVSDHRGGCGSDVAAHLTGNPGLAENVPGHCRGCRLAVRSRDANHRSAQPVAGEFHLTDYRYAALLRRDDLRNIGGNARAKNNEVDGSERFHALGQNSFGWFCIAEPNGRSVRTQQISSTLTRFAKAGDEDDLA